MRNAPIGYSPKHFIHLVGGASTILGTGYGPQIDAADVVVRINVHWPCPAWHQPQYDAMADVGQRILDSMVERTAFERAMPSLRRAVNDAHRYPCI